MPRMLTTLAVLAILGALLWSLGRMSSSTPGDSAALPTSVPAPSGTVPNGTELYDPVRAGEPLPEGFRQLIPRDGIRPVYDPAFVAASASGWPDDTLVIGVAIDGDARAYPVRFLNRREMVIDRIAGIPVLVTW